ncbi:hypothetical protein ABMA28_009977 [Loxostege sticticalis]|uniref:Uncharacterized protein n=1 Tax=Loxostege sticticalis TaxID=481309 RepID=A0ABD0SE89_LOXSC
MISEIDPPWELDLQDIRRALVYLLDEPDDEECFICNRLRCRCAEYTLTSFRSSPSDIGMAYPLYSSTDSISELDYSYISPPDTDSEISEFDYVDFAPPPHHTSSSFEDYIDVTAAQALPTPPPANTLPTPPWDCKSQRSSPISPEAELKAYYDDLLQWVRVSHPEVTEAGPDMPFPINESINNETNMSWPPHPKSIWYVHWPEYSRDQSLFMFYKTYTAYLLNAQQNSKH